MSLSLLQNAAADNQWLAILPELMLGLTALVLLLLELVLDKKNHSIIPSLSIAAQLGIFAALIAAWRPGLSWETFNGMLQHTPTGQFMRIFFVLCSILVTFLGMLALNRHKLPRIEFFHLVLVITAAMMLLAQADHLVMLFVALETVTIGFYVLVSYFRHQSPSLEAGIKYLIMGGLSSAVLLFGIVLLYGVASTRALPGATAEAFDYDNLRLFLAENPGNMLANIGIVLVLAGVAFKIGAFPFQFWVPDVYQGAPTPVTAFLAVGSKAAGFAVLLRLTHTVFAPYQGLVITVLAVLAAGTILFGNLAAVTQHNVKRLMGLSGVSHAGYLLIGVIAFSEIPSALGAILFYLLSYLLAAMAVFGVMIHVAGEQDADQDLDHYADLGRRSPFLGAVLAIGLGSLAGIPPLAGFIGKLLVFIAAFKAGLYWLLAVAILGVVISIYYYFGWMKSALFTIWRAPQAEPGKEAVIAPIQVGVPAVITLGLLAVFSVVLGLYQGPLGRWFSGV